MKKDIFIFNSLSHKQEVFVPIKNLEVSMYHCGPTVYDFLHLGNYRTIIMNDIIRRIFEYNNYAVKQVMNITDVDDKTIAKSRELKVSLGDLTKKYEEIFLIELKSLNVLQPHNIVRATDYISSMINLIEILIKKGFAYVAEDGVYMTISKVDNYGSLAQLGLKKDLKHRIQNDEYDKDSPQDFALWKFKSTNDGDVFWPANFGDGRPGWHIECSAMAMEKLGETIDIHTGGIDLIFPHHTNEIAQSESVTEKKFVNYWVHGAFMTNADEKMAKSKGNIAKLSSLEEELISPLAFKYWLFTAHYRSPINFSIDAVRAAQNALIKLMTIVSTYPENGIIIPDYNNRFHDYINNDFDMPKSISLVWELIKDSQYSEADKRATIISFDKVFGLRLDSVEKIIEEIIPIEIQVLAEAREEARKEKDWVKADGLRLEIESRGYRVNDTSDGIKIQSI